MSDRTAVHVGDHVLTSDAHKVGTVSFVGDNYMHLLTGFLGLGPDFYIPFDAVDRSGDHNLYLNVAWNDLAARERDWSRRPAELTAAAPAAAIGREATLGPADLRGKRLCSSDNREIGTITDIGSNSVNVATGLAGLGDRLYVPLDAISRCSQDRCYLNVAYDRVSAMGWGQQPRRQAVAGGREVVHEYRIPLVEEELEVHRHREQVGEVVISKDVVEEQRSIDVPVAHEEVRIERHDVERPVTEERPFTETEQELRVPIYEERLDVEKHPHVHEEIVVTPEEVTREEHVTDTVRREVPRVKTTGEADELVHGEETIEEDVERKNREP